MIIQINNLSFQSPLGIHQEEHLLKNTIRLDAEIFLENTQYSDKMEECIDYTALCTICKNQLAVPCKTLEFACQNLGNKLLNFDNRIVKVSLCLTKLHPAVRFNLESVAVKMEFSV